MQLFRQWPVLIGGSALLVGLGLGTWISADRLLIVVWSAVGLALLGGLGTSTRTNWLVALSSVGLVATVGVIYSLWQESRFPSVAPAQLTDIRGFVVSAPELTGTTQRAYVDLTDRPLQTRVRASWTTGTMVRYGDVVTLTGALGLPEQSKDFNERGFLRAHGAAGTLKLKVIAPTGAVDGNPILRMFQHVRRWLLTRLDRALNQPQETIVAGVLIGARSGLDKSIDAAFQATSTTHILVVSGANVLILAQIIRFLFTPLGRRWSSVVAGGLLLGFIAITGADASVVRATVFALLLILAELTGRRIHSLTLITAIAAGMAFLNPWILLYDISFQLSFGAVLGLTLFSRWFERLLPAWIFPEYLAPTLAAQLMTLPILLYHFGQASLVAPLANLLVEPMVPAIMAGGALVLILPWFRPIVWATQGLVTLLLWFVTHLAVLPYASVTLATNRALWAGITTLIAVAVWLWRQRWRKTASWEARLAIE